MTATQKDIPAPDKAALVSQVLDHLVNALGGEPACTLRRAVILADIDQHPGTTQADIMERLAIHKSALNRDIEWLYDYGCILRRPCPEDGRILRLYICGYAKKNMDFALSYFDFSHLSLKNLLNGLIDIFGQHKPTLRDAKIISLLGHKDAATRQEVLESLYNGPISTDNRAVNNLINAGLVQKKNE